MPRIVATVLLLMGLVACSGQSDRVTVRYNTLGEAVADGAVTRGWVPDWLPKSSAGIEESHDLDTNVSALLLRFTHSEEWQPPAECEDADLPSVPDASGLDDWPEDVPPKWSTPRHRYMQCEGGKAYLAFSFQSGELYYWRPNGI